MFLQFDQETGEVTGHEGRHRMQALLNDGIERVAITLIPDGEKGRYSRTRITDIKLTGQYFNERVASGEVMISEALPLSREYEQEVRVKFGQQDSAVKFSLRNTQNMTYDEQMDAYFNKNGKNLSSNDSICLRDTKGVFSTFGMEERLIALTQNVVRKGIETHNLTEDDVRLIQKGLDAPVFAIVNPAQEVLIYTGERDGNGKPVAVIMAPGAQIDFQNVYRITSVHGRNEPLATINNFDNGSRYVVYDENKLAELLHGSKVLSLEPNAVLSKFTKVNLSSNGAPVKPQLRTNPESDAEFFVR